MSRDAKNVLCHHIRFFEDNLLTISNNYVSMVLVICSDEIAYIVKGFSINRSFFKHFLRRYIEHVYDC